MNESRSPAVGSFKRRHGSLRVFLSPAEQVAVVGALHRELALPDTDHETIRALIARLAS